MDSSQPPVPPAPPAPPPGGAPPGWNPPPPGWTQAPPQAGWGPAPQGWSPPPQGWGQAPQGWGQPPQGWSQPSVSAGSLVEHTLKTWWRNLGKFTLMTFLAYLVIFGAMVVGAAGMAGVYLNGLGRGAELGDALVSPAFVAALVVGVLLGMAIVVAQTAGLSHGTVRFLAGGQPEIGAMWRVGFRRLLPVLGVSLLFSLAVGFGCLLLLVPGVMAGAALCLAIPVAAVEGRGVLESFSRSVALTEGHRMSLFLAFLVIVAINFGVSMVGGFLALILPIVGQLISLGLNVLIGSLAVVLPAVAYFDLKVAKEGLDAGGLAKVFE